MLIAIVLDRPLAEAKALVDDPAAFTREMTRILREKQNHPLIAQMINQRKVVIHPPPIPQPVAPVAVKNLAPPHTCSFSKLLELT